jgi:predicted ATPase/truncated hemoglobin YjbI
MRISKITIRNFRSIEATEIVPGPFNVFVGQNNHGKTNFFEAVEWFYNGSGDLGQIAYLRDPNRNVSVEIEYSGVQSGIEAVKNEKTKESFKKFAGGRDVLRVLRQKSDGAKRTLWDEKKGEWSPNNFAGFDKSFNDCIPRLQYVATTTRLSDISKFGKRTPIGEMLSGVLTAILEKSPKYREFRKAFEELFSSDGSDVKVELGALAEKVKGHLQQQFPDCSKVAFGVGEPAFEELLKNFETSIDDGIETTAEEKGDGMQRALMLAIIKTYSDFRREKDEAGKRFLFLIDEAELHLHPTAQRQLKDALVLLAQAGDQVFINTHSSVLVADDAEGQALWRVQKADRVTGISPITEGDKPEVVYELLGGSPSDLLLPCNFMLVEGKSEYELLARVVRRFYADRPRIKVIFAGGDLPKQEKSMDAINTAFTPLNQTPIYRDRLVISCDMPNAQQQNDFNEFNKAYPHLQKGGQLVVAPSNALEEAYPGDWKRTKEQIGNMGPGGKVQLARMVGDAISREDFEQSLKHMHQALTVAWEKAHK